MMTPAWYGNLIMTNSLKISVLESLPYALKQMCVLEVAKVAYFAFSQSHLRYGITIWEGWAASSALERVIIWKKQAVQCLASLKFQETCQTVFTELKILTVVTSYIQEAISQYNLCHSTQSSKHLQLQHQKCLKFCFPAYHFSMYSKKESYSRAKLFNLLLKEIKNSNPR